MMFAGIHFPSAFTRDNFNARRNHGSVGNAYDPESLITGAEIQAGMTYLNSKRDWVSEAEYKRAVQGLITPDDIVCLAPRRKVFHFTAETFETVRRQAELARLHTLIPRQVIGPRHGPQSATLDHGGLDRSQPRIRPGSTTLPAVKECDATPPFYTRPCQEEQT